jgi:hypothetical protein
MGLRALVGRMKRWKINKITLTIYRHMMKRLLLFSLIIFQCVLANAQSIPSTELQIKTAIMAAPSEQRENATVYGLNAKNEFVMLRKGTNEMICLADDPAQKGLNVSCYHKDLDPFMERGRILKKEGKSHQDIFTIREDEVKAGKLKMPSQPTTLFSFTAPDEKYNKETGEVQDGYLRYVVYIPYATAASTGLPTKPDVAGMPWIMDPGTHRAHIMISPAPKN